MRSCVITMLLLSLAGTTAPGCNQTLADRSVQITAEPTAEGEASGAATDASGTAARRGAPAEPGVKKSATELAASDAGAPESASTGNDDASLDALLGSMEGVDPAIRDLARRQILAARNLRHADDAPAQTAAATSGAPATSNASLAATASLSAPSVENAADGAVHAAIHESAAPEASLAAVSAAAEEPQPIAPASVSRRAMTDGTVQQAVAVTEDQDDKKPLETFELAEQLIANLEAEEIDPTAPVGYQKLVMLRTLYALTERVDEAAEPVDGLEIAEQQFLQNQMLALAAVATPDSSPVRSRRYVQGLPHLRQAVSHLAAATGSLELQNLQFCTDVQDFGIVKPFESNRFKPGQEVLLYCEIENFGAEQNSGGFETHFQGTYELFNGAGERVFHQVLPGDQQTCNRLRRDYFIAYHMYLPQRLAAGEHRLRLTIEDLKGKKYGQADVEFEVTDSQ